MVFVIYTTLHILILIKNQAVKTFLTKIMSVEYKQKAVHDLKQDFTFV